MDLALAFAPRIVCYREIGLKRPSEKVRQIAPMKSDLRQTEGTDLPGPVHVGSLAVDLEPRTLQGYLQFNRIIRRMNQILFCAEVPLGGLDRGVAEQ